MDLLVKRAMDHFVEITLIVPNLTHGKRDEIQERIDKLNAIFSGKKKGRRKKSHFKR
jgi:hypothetical protein